MQKIRIFTTLYMLILCSVSYGQYVVYDSEVFLAKADSLIAQQDYTEAIKQLRYINRFDDYYLDAHTKIATCLVAKDSVASAISMYKELYNDKVFKENPNLYVEYANVLTEQKEYEKAIALYEEACNEYPNYSYLLLNYAILLYTKGDFQECVNQLQKSIEINPYAARSHYLLGVIALENGRVSEGALAFMAYLSIAPNDNFASNAISSLNVKMSQNYLSKSDIVLSEEGDNFDNLDIILRNDLHLNDNFELKCDIDEIYTRTLQAIVTYAPSHNIRNGFFERNYMSFIQSIAKRNLIEGFTYYTLSGIPNVADKISKKKKEVSSFQNNYLESDFPIDIGRRKRSLNNKESEFVLFCEDYLPYTLAKVDGNNLKQGSAIFYDDYGNKAGEVFYVDGQPNGIVPRYSVKGYLSYENTYKKGVLDGEQKEYYSNGNLKQKWMMLDGNYEGPYTTYYKDGTKLCESTYKNGKLEGQVKCNFENGSTKYIAHYEEEVLQGLNVNYLENGEVANELNYIDGKLNGLAKYYNELGQLLYTTSYKDDIDVGEYDLSNINGDIYYSAKINGKIKESMYYVNSKPSVKEFHKKGVLQSQDLYMDGIKYLSVDYDGESISGYTQYYKDQSKGKKLNLDRAEVRDPFGNLLAELSYKDGLPIGTFTNYYSNGVTKSVEHYKKGKQDGVSVYYDSNGDKELQYISKDGQLNGSYIEYDDGIEESVYYYRNNEIHGPGVRYHRNGKSYATTYYNHANPFGAVKYYDIDGRLTAQDDYDRNGELFTSIVINREDKPDTLYSEEQYSGQVVIKDQSLTESTINIVNGVNNGIYYRTIKGDTLYKAYYLNGKRNGLVQFWNPLGFVQYEAEFANGLCYGDASYFDDLGALRVKSRFIADEEYGIERLYTPEGKVYDQFYNQNEQLHGIRSFFNSQGDTLLQLYYINDLIFKYKTLNDAVWNNISAESTDITSDYNDGSLALQVTVNQQIITGKLLLNNPDNTPLLVKNYDNGKIDGELIKYYETGEPYLRKQYKNGVAHGPVVYFDKEGNKTLEYENVFSNIHGLLKYSRNGNVVKKLNYHYDEIIGIE